ncbi:MAG TPA: hypothetical protein VID48_10990 [Solirubrobacteraceae bacterium]
MTTETPARAPVAKPVEEGILGFYDTPVFEVVCWKESGLHYMQTRELDLVASATDENDLPRKLGTMIMNLFLSLAALDADDRTDSEEQTLALIGERLGPPLTRYHQRQRESLYERIRAVVVKNLEWRVGPPSTPHGSLPALSG